LALVPVICDNCHILFTTNSLFGGNLQQTTFKNVGYGPCPVCGSDGSVPDGVYNLIGNTIELLSGPATRVPELRILAEILRNARIRRAAPAEVQKAVEEKVPQFAQLISQLAKYRNDFYQTLAIIIAVISALISYSQSGKELPKIEVNQVINFISQQPPEAPKTQQLATPSTTQKIKKKFRRNELCYCGSNKKYKKCHGQ
jgi:hypothetical protein